MRRRRSPPTPAAWRSGVPPDLLDVLLDYDRPAHEIAEIEARGIAYDRFLSFCRDEPEVAARLADAVAAAGGAMQNAPGFDWVFLVKGARSLFRKPEPSVRVAVRIVPFVDGACVESAWQAVLRLAADDQRDEREQRQQRRDGESGGQVVLVVQNFDV